MKSTNREIGTKGEELAVKYLKKKGYKILEQNWRFHKSEIDIIAFKKKTVVFVEVKTRRGRQLGSPEEGLTVEKAKRLLQLAQIYLSEEDVDADWRIDLVAVELDETGKLIRCDHIPSAVLGW